LNKKTEFR